MLKKHQNHGYSVISNYHLRDKELSLKGKGMLTFMFQLPDTWQYNIRGLATVLKESESGIRTALKELQELKYLKIEQERLPNGRMGKSVYHIYEVPQVEKPHAENSHAENHRQLITKGNEQLKLFNKLIKGIK